MSGLKASAAMIVTGMTGAIAANPVVEHVTFLQDLNENSAAYGLIASFIIGSSGVISMAAFGIWNARRDYKKIAEKASVDASLLAEQIRHNKAIEDRVND